MNYKKLKEYYFGIDGAILALSLIALFMSIYFLLQDDSAAVKARGELTAVGKFNQSRNDVRRRVQSGFTWATVSPKDTVYEGDSIFTGDESDASIQLESGGKIQIDPKSLVVVRTQGKSLALDLQYGSLVGKVSGDAPLLISQNGQLQELTSEDAEIRIETTAEKETKIQVVKGEVQLNKVNKQKKSSDEPKPPPQVIRQNEVLEMKAAAAPVIKKVQVELVAPDTGKTLWMPLGQSVVFRWKYLGGNPPAKGRMELSRDINFEQKIAAYEIAGTAVSLPDKNRPTGTFHWRIRPTTNNPNEEALPSAPSRLTLYPDSPPLPTFPTDGQGFAYNAEAGETGKQVLLSWEDQSGSTEFEVQLASDTEFKNLIFKKRLELMSERTPLLEGGNYYWRVKGLHPQRNEPPWSPTFRFAIEEDAKTPEAPILAETRIDYEIPEQVLLRAPSNVSLSGRGVQPEQLKPFAWNTVTSAESYEVEVAPTESFENSIKQNLGADTTFAPQEIKPGPLFVRVRAKGRKGLVSAPSQTGRLEVGLPAPNLETPPPETQTFTDPVTLEKAKHDFKVKWSPRPFAESYELEWGADSTFEKSKKFRLKPSERAIVVTKPGDYAARVRALGPEGIPLSAFSEVKIASYRKELVAPVIAKPAPPPPQPAAPPVRAPAAKPKLMGEKPVAGPGPNLLEPRRDTSFVSLENSVAFVNFRWAATRNAEFYEVQISEDADFTKVVTTFKSKSNRYTFQKSLPEGRVFWRVRAHTKEQQTDWSDVFDINVLYQ